MISAVFQAFDVFADHAVRRLFWIGVLGALLIQIVLALFGIILILCKRIRFGEQEIGSPLAQIIGGILVAPLPLSLWITIATKMPAAYQNAFQTTHNNIHYIRFSRT